MLNGGSMVWGFCVYFVYIIPLETDVLRKHRFQKEAKLRISILIFIYTIHFAYLKVYTKFPTHKSSSC